MRRLTQPCAEPLTAAPVAIREVDRHPTPIQANSRSHVAPGRLSISASETMGVRRGSDQGQTQVGAGSERGQTGVRPGSDTGQTWDRPRSDPLAGGIPAAADSCHGLAARSLERAASRARFRGGRGAGARDAALARAHLRRGQRRHRPPLPARLGERTAGRPQHRLAVHDGRRLAAGVRDHASRVRRPRALPDRGPLQRDAARRDPARLHTSPFSATGSGRSSSSRSRTAAGTMVPDRRASMADSHCCRAWRACSAGRTSAPRRMAYYSWFHGARR